MNGSFVTLKRALRTKHESRVFHCRRQDRNRFFRYTFLLGIETSRRSNGLPATISRACNEHERFRDEAQISPSRRLTVRKIFRTSGISFATCHTTITYRLIDNGCPRRSFLRLDSNWSVIFVIARGMRIYRKTISHCK